MNQVPATPTQAETAASNASAACARVGAAPIRLCEVLRANASNGKALPLVPGFRSNGATHTEWQVHTGTNGAESPATPPKWAAREAARHAAEQDRLAALLEKIRAWADAEPAAAQKIFPRELRLRFRVPESLWEGLTDALHAASWATPHRRRDGLVRSWCLVPAAPAAEPLRALIQRLPAATDGGGRGRRGAARRTELTALSDSQRGDALSLATLLERYGELDGLDPRDAPALLARPDLAARVASLSDRVAREKRLAAGQPWSPASNAMRPKLVGAVANVQAVAAAHGLVALRQHDGPLPPQHDAAAQPLLDELRVELTALDARPHACQRVDRGLRVLGRLLTRRGWFTVDEMEPATLLDDVLAMRASGYLVDQDYYAVSHVWRRLPLLQQRAPFPQRAAAQLFHQRLLRDAIDARTELHAVRIADASPWILPGGQALLDGPYGLRRVLEYTTASTHLLGVQAGMPATRVRVSDVRDAVPRLVPAAVVHWLIEVPHDADASRAWSDAYTEQAGQQLRRAAARLRRLTSDGDVTLTAVARLDAVQRVAQDAGWLTFDRRAQAGLSARGSEYVDVVLSVLWFLAQLAVHDGDRGAAETFLEERGRLVQWRRRLTKHRTASHGSDPEHKRIEEIDVLWRGSDAIHGFVRLGQLRDCLIGRAVAVAKCSLEEQAEILERDGAPAWPVSSWRFAIRNALLIHLLRMMPLRSNELAQLTLDMLSAKSDGVVCPLWTPGCEVSSLIPRDVMKSPRDRDAILIRQHDSAEAHARFMPSLFALYLLPGGARDALKVRGDGMFVHQGRRSMRHGQKLSQSFRREVLRYASVLKLDGAALQGHFGASGLHVIRLLVGKYAACELGNIMLAMTLLHHSDPQVTIRKYVGSGGRHMRIILPN